jgi:hypothetical protein
LAETVFDRKWIIVITSGLQIAFRRAVDGVGDVVAGRRKSRENLGV